jgi:hypothetical protein
MAISYDPAVLEHDASAWEQVSSALDQARTTVQETTVPPLSAPDTVAVAFSEARDALAALIGQGTNATAYGAGALRAAASSFSAADQEASDRSNALRFEQDQS